MSNDIERIAKDGIDALNAWLAKAGLRGEPEAALVSAVLRARRRRRPAD